MGHKLTSLEAVEIVLRELNCPLNLREIVHEIKNRQLFKFSGNYPHQTISARLSEHISKYGGQSKFKRVGPGRFALRDFPMEEYIPIPIQPINYRTSRVLVFPAEKLNSIGYFHGINRDYKKYFENLLTPNVSFQMPRVQAESDSKFKQVISYIIIKYKDSLLRFTRGKLISLEKKNLYQSYSIGFGGHVEGIDMTLFNFDDLGYSNSVKRELREEIGINSNYDGSPKKNRMIGVLNDDSSDLGRNHFAFIQILELSEPNFRKSEKSINELSFIGIPNIAEEFLNYEYWSQLCIQTFFGTHLTIGCHVQERNGFSLKDNSNIIIVTGYQGSGKKEICSILNSKYNCELISGSSIQKELLQCPTIKEIGRKKFQDLIFDFFNQEKGHEKFVASIIEYLNHHQGSNYVLYGFQYPETLRILKQKIGKPVTVLYIESSIDNLYQHFRNRENETLTFQEFQDMINHPVERQIQQFYSIADIIVYKHGSTDSCLGELNDYFNVALGSPF